MPHGSVLQASSAVWLYTHSWHGYFCFKEFCDGLKLSFPAPDCCICLITLFTHRSESKFSSGDHWNGHKVVPWLQLQEQSFLFEERNENITCGMIRPRWIAVILNLTNLLFYIYMSVQYYKYQQRHPQASQLWYIVDGALATALWC